MDSRCGWVDYWGRGMHPRSWWGHLGRSRGARGGRPSRGHGGEGQATRRRWRQGIRERWARRKAIHEWGWGPLDTWGSRWEAGRGRGLLHLKVELKKKLLSLSVPMGPELALSLVNLPAWHLEGDGLVGLSGHEQVLPAAVRGLNPLLVGRHEAVAWHDALCDLRIVNLEQQALLAHLCVPLLGHFVARAANLDKLLHLYLDLLRGRLGGGLLGLLGSSPGQVSLMFLPLGMGQVAPLIVMQGQAEFALIGPQVVLHKIRVLVDVDGFKGQLPQPLPPVPVALGGGGHAPTPSLASRSVLKVHGAGLATLEDRKKTWRSKESKAQNTAGKRATLVLNSILQMLQLQV